MKSARARLRIRRRVARFYAVLPTLRWLAAVTLLVSLSIGGFRWLSQPSDVGALEFTPHAIGGAPGVRGLTPVDLDGDDDIDVVTTGMDGVKVYVNEGGLNFSLKIVDDKDSERSQAVDFDRDGDLDLLVAFRGDAPSVRWYRNEGSIEFTDFTIATAGADAIAAAGDLDADGYPDIVTASGRESIVLERWMNDGAGNFVSTTLDADTTISAVVVADIMRNGYGDIVVGGTDGLQRWSTNDGSTWFRVDIDDSNANRTHLTIGDPQDGRLWIVTGDIVVDELSLYRSGVGDTTYRRYEVASSIDAKSVRSADLDNDGDLDLLVAAQDASTVYWYENDGLDHFTQRTLAPNLQGVYDVATADFDGDGDLDVVTDDPGRGQVYIYERLRKRSEATAPGEIKQSTDNSGRVTFTSTISDVDGDPTRIRIQYSVDGDHWYKPWLTAVSADAGSVDLDNSRGYQVGTIDPIDTDIDGNVKLTFTWDTKSSENTGGPIIGDVDSVQLRIIPRDDQEVGEVAVSSKFRVDNEAPTGLKLRLVSITDTEASLAWDMPNDSSGFRYHLYYGTDHAAVLERRADEWAGSTEASLADQGTTATTITGLTPQKTYTFKLFVEDDFGNSAGAPSVRSKTLATAPPGGTPTPTGPPGDGTPTPPPGGTPTPPPSGEFTPTPPPGSPGPTPDSSTPTPTPRPTTTVPPVLQQNSAPLADAGPDQVVNPRALVILDGTASFDPDPGDTAALTYSWRQISGPDIELLSERTATPSFSAGNENETYIFSLTVRDLNGASAIDTVTVATKALPPSTQTIVDVDTTAPTVVVPEAPESPLISVLKLSDLLLLGLSLLSTTILLLDRLSHAVRDTRARSTMSAAPANAPTSQSRVVHYKTGEPIAGAQVLIYGADGKLRAQERTNDKGVFSTFFPPGQYTLGVKVDGFAFAPAASKSIAPPEGVIYTGGKLTIKDSAQPPTIVIPLKPTAGEITSARVRFLHAWQTIQHVGRLLSWPLFLAGALLNTALIFLAPGFLYLAIEVLYIVLVIVKIALEVRMRPAYGLVRDAITHIPLELAVVRLFEAGTNRLIMTRVTNNQGKFFALPPAGNYTITISKPGYGMFTRENVTIESEHDTALQVTADLMPVAPQRGGGLAHARAATI